MKKINSITAILLVVFLLLSQTACTKEDLVTSAFTINSSESELNSLPTVSSASEHSFQTSEDVVNDLREKGSDYGFKNALSEISHQSTTVFDGDTFIRMQQYYKGIPVWGRGAVCVIDESGRETALVGNCVDIPEIDTSVTAVTKQSLEDSLRSYCTTKLGCSNECVYIFDVPEETQQCIYVDENSTAHLAYTMLLRLQDKGESNALELLVRADDGSVLLAQSILISNKEATGSLTGQRNTYSSVTYSQENGTYKLYDAKRNITAYIANSETPFDWEYILDLLAWSPHKKVWDGHAATIVSWDAESFPDTSSVDAYVNTQITYDFFNEVLQNPSTDGNGDAVIKLVTDVQYKDSKNWTGKAYSSSGVTNDGIKETNLVFGRAKTGDVALSAYLDAVAHEYMHAVERFHSGMIYQGESGAIMEALSDIFGELVESWHTNQRPNWINSVRNIKNPGAADYPARIDEENRSGEDFVHGYSTAISHAAYLMWNGLDGQARKKISTEQLANLWYRAMLMMPSDCSFSECRTLVELAAKSVGLKEMQLQCISESFDAVGIGSGEIADYDLTSDATLAVYDANDGLCGNYTMFISGWTIAGAEELPAQICDTGNAIIWLDNHKVSYSETRKIEEAAEIPIDLELGTYTICLVDNSDATKSLSFSINTCRSNGKSKLELYTGFNKKTGVSSFEADKNTYVEFLLNGGYESACDLTVKTDSEKNSVELRSAMCDLNNDGTFELCLEIVRGGRYDDYSAGMPFFCFTIVNGSVELLCTYSSGGGNWVWGDVELKYDSITEQHVICDYTVSVDSRVETGYITITEDVYGFESIAGKNSMVSTVKLYSEQVDPKLYADWAAKLKARTNLWYEEGAYVCVAQIDDHFVSATDYARRCDALVEPTDENYVLKNGTYYDPIPYNMHGEETNDVATPPTYSEGSASGTCGDNLTWHFAPNTGVLTIEGSGLMKDYEQDGMPPWYDYCDSITTVSIQNGVSSIGNYAFCWCWYMTSVTIPNSVIRIGEGAFAQCVSLKNVTIPEGVRDIGCFAFLRCLALIDVTVPRSVTSIGEGAFAVCSSSIRVASDNTNYSSQDGVLFNKSKTELIQYPAGKADTTYTIPSSVSGIGGVAFAGCGLMSVTIPEGVTTIGAQAFAECDSLMSVTIPEGVTTIGARAFAECDSLTSVTIPNSVTSISDEAFYGCSSLTSVTIPNSVTSIGDKAFSWCKSLTSVTISEGVNSIGYRAFCACRSLTSVTIPNSVISIADEAFYDCSSLTNVTILHNVASIGDKAFGYVIENLFPKRIDGFTIHGYTGTAAQSYADENGFQFVNIGA